MLLASDVLELAQKFARELLFYGVHSDHCAKRPASKRCTCGLNDAKEKASAFLADFPSE